MLGQSHLRDRDEAEVRGYRAALKLIHERGAKLNLTEDLILELHRLSRARMGDAGQYKERDKRHYREIQGRAAQGSLQDGARCRNTTLYASAH